MARSSTDHQTLEHQALEHQASDQVPTAADNGFQRTQYQFAAHLRHPELNPAPEGIEDRRMAIYRDLFYNNIEGFIASGFPILRSLIDDEPWQQLVRDFIHRHHSHTPYFLKISEEFLHYLQEEFPSASLSLPELPFLLELAHYEWVELALDTADTQPAQSQDNDVTAALANGNSLLDVPLTVSPLAWRLSYQYPVHLIGPEFQPQQPPEQPTFLVVYRNDDDVVNFLAVNAMTVNLLQLLEQQSGTGRDALTTLAAQMDAAVDNLLLHGEPLLQQLYDLTILR